MKILIIFIASTIIFTSGSKPIKGIIIGSSEDTDGFPSYDYYLDPPTSKKETSDNQPSIKNGDRISHITLTKQVPYPVPHPIPYPVYEKIPYPVKVPVPVKIDQPYEVKVYKPYPVRVDKPVPYQVIKNVPIPVKVPVNVPVPIKIPVLVPQPYPVKITKTIAVPVPETVFVKKPVLVYIDNQGKIQGESDITEDDGFNRDDKRQFVSKWNTKSGAIERDEAHMLITKEIRFENGGKMPQGYRNQEINTGRSFLDASRKRFEGHHDQNWKTNGSLKHPSQKVGHDKVITGLSTADLNRKILEGKRNMKFGVNAQYKTIKSYVWKLEDTVNPDEEKTSDFKDQVRIDSEKNDQNQTFIKLSTDGNRSPRKNYGAENGFKSEADQFEEREFTGLGAYATRPEGQN